METQLQPPGKLERVYNYLKKQNKVKAATYEEFEQKMQETDKLQKVYDHLKGEGKVKAASFEEFQDRLGLKKKEETPLPQAFNPPAQEPGITEPLSPSGDTSATPSADQVAEAKQFVTDTQARLEGSNPDREQNPLVTIGKTFWNLAAYQIPAALAATAGVMAVGDPGVPGAQLSEEDRKGIRKEVSKFSLGLQKKGGELTKNITNTIDKIEDPLDAINYVVGALTQAGVQIPASIMTAGASSFGQEIGGIYLASLERIAQERGITPEQVIEQGLDEPGLALAYGAGAGALDYIGAGRVANAFTKDSIKKTLRDRALATIKSGATVEAGTEYFQTWLEQVGEEQSAGKSFGDAVKEVLTNPAKKKERLEATAQGAIGGGAGSVIGSATQGKEKVKSKIKEDAIQERSPETLPVVPTPGDSTPVVEGVPEQQQETPQVQENQVQEEVTPPVTENIEPPPPTNVEQVEQTAERDRVFSAPLNEVTAVINDLMDQEKKMMKGEVEFGPFIDMRDAKETKGVAKKYLNPEDLTDEDIRKDFRDALTGRPSTWYADGLKLRESARIASDRGITMDDLLQGVMRVFTADGYSEQQAKEVIAGYLSQLNISNQGQLAPAQDLEGTVEAPPINEQPNGEITTEGGQEALLTENQTSEEQPVEDESIVDVPAPAVAPPIESDEEVSFDWLGSMRTGKVVGKNGNKLKIKSKGTTYNVAASEVKPVTPAIKKAMPKKEEQPIAYNSKRKQPIGIVSNGLTGSNFFGMQTDLGKKIVNFFKKEFTSKGFLPKQVFDRWIGASGEINKYETQLKFTLTDIKKAIKSEYSGKPTDQQITDINLALQGKTPSLPLPPKVAKQVNEMRNQIDNLSRRFINEGVVSGDLSAKFQQNLGTYLTRSYRKFDDPFWSEFVPVQVLNKAEGFLRGKYPNHSDEEIQGLIKYIMYDPQAPGALLKGAKLGSKDLSILKKKGDIAPELRALMGEYGDPLLNYARTMTKMANLIAKHHFLEDVRNQGLGDYLFEKPTGKYSVPIAAEGSRTMAPLNGLYTTPEIAETFQEFGHMEPMSDMLKAYMKLNGWIKLGKTVFSVMTHARNMFGNVGFATMNGHWRLDKAGKAIQVAFANIYANDQAVRDKFKEYVELGIVQDSGAAGELRQYVKDIRENKDFFERINDNKLKKVKDAVINTTTNLYQFEDDMYKIFAFENEMARYEKAYPNMPKQELKEKVARIVRDTYPTYSMVPNMVKRFRGNPLVGSFVSFPAEVLRTTYNTIALAKKELADPSTRSIGAQRAAGIMMASLLPTAMSYATRALLGLDGQDDDDLKKFVAPWQTDSEFLYQKVDGDKYTVIDMGYSDPHSYLKRPIYDLLKGRDLAQSAVDAAQSLAQPFLSEELLAERLIDISRNQKKNGDHVYNPDGTFGDIAADVYAHFKPIAEPGTALSLRRLMKAYTGETDKYGNKYELQNELIGFLTGFKSETKDTSQSMLFKAYELKDRIDITEKELMRVQKNKSASPEEKADAQRKHDAAIKNIVTDAVDLYYSAIRLGVDPKEAKRDLFRTRSPQIVQAVD